MDKDTKKIRAVGGSSNVLCASWRWHFEVFLEDLFQKVIKGWLKTQACRVQQA
jgi:hypothetical protein